MKTGLIRQVLLDAIMRKASDVHISIDLPPVFRINGILRKMNDESFTKIDLDNIVSSLLNDAQRSVYLDKGEIDLAYSIDDIGRFRINLYRQGGSHAIAIRIIPDRIPSGEELGIPPIVNQLAELEQGFVIVTGPTGSGKSTTLAAMVDLINSERRCHIITIEDPIEYIHRHKKSIIHQRELGSDTKSFSEALRAALRQDPDVILIGEMRDLETTATAITAAETGHLVLSTLHTSSTVGAIERIVDLFPPYQQAQIRGQLAQVLKGSIAQKLLPRADLAGRVAAFEVLTATPAIKNLIREGKTHQIHSIMQTSTRHGMQTMENSLNDLFEEKLISRETYLACLKEYKL